VARHARSLVSRWCRVIGPDGLRWVCVAAVQPVFTDAERVALAGLPAGYRGLTREAYALDLRQFTSWCRSRSVALFAVRGSTMSLTRLRWTATSSARSLSLPGSAHHRCIRCSR
jgi:hypothetical protein